MTYGDNRAARLIGSASTLAVAALLSACSHSGTHSGTDGSTNGSTPPNPVPILQRAGCTIAPDVKIGQPALGNTDVYFAACTWGDPSDFGETLTVWAYRSNHDRDADTSDIHWSDGTTVIFGDKFIGELTEACCSTPKYPAAPSVVAARIGGVIKPRPGG